ncbi:NlpC/P60 family protein [Nocardiopsis dassonvillei]|uniref:C40 family peptidase n=1 Tax=Nocardiopsis dassonvillei TaxID=2014 RepID=UPI0020A40220|nr:C40 family peptidase [Nocardiopsis dassonvillei]MCP3013543.1 NlpC/P60 family protein [Nocardiopsis dassonvillei]
MLASRRVRRRRTAALASLTAAALLLPTAVAHADPTAEEVREEIEALEEEYIELNAAYNEAKETHEAAQEELEGILEEIEAAEEKVAELGLGARQLASSTYTGVDFTSFHHLLSSTGPEDALAHQADLDYLSTQNDGNLAQYVTELENLEVLEAEASATEEEAAEALKEAEEATEAAEEAIEEQEGLLSELTAEEQAAATQNVGQTGGGSSAGGGGGGGGGGSYTGPATGSAATALNFAYAQVGKPYVWGGTGPGGYDCSGLTQAAWAAAGVSLPRTTYQQVNAGQRVSWENKQPGDLLFFYPGGSGPEHVGLYAGDNVMVHASTSARPIGTVTLNDYYRANFVTAVRP